MRVRFFTVICMSLVYGDRKGGENLMSNLKKILILAVFALLAFPSVAFASDEDRFETRTRIDGDRLEVRSESGDEEFRFKADDEEFEVRGTVTDISGNTFTVDGVSVTIDPTMVEDFEQEVDLIIGEDVKAEGVIIDGVNFAEEIEAE